MERFNRIFACWQGLPRTLPGAGILLAIGRFHRPATLSNRPILIPIAFSEAYSDFRLLFLPVPSGFHRLSRRQQAGSVPSAPAEPQFPPEPLPVCGKDCLLDLYPGPEVRTMV
jgi:hypothetical protein